jgi:outer membrane protein assembly factor BamB
MLALLIITSLVTGHLTVLGQDVVQEPLPRFRASLDNLGQVPGGAPVNNTSLWTVPTDSPILSSPVVTEGRVYVGTMGGELLCLNAFTGRTIWAQDLGSPIESTPAVKGEFVYVGTDSGRLFCLNARDGTPTWNVSTGAEIKSSPTVVDDMVYVGSNDFNVYAFDTDDGAKVWNFTTGGYVYSSPAYLDDAVYFGSCDGNMYSVNATSGEEVWSFEADFCPASPAVTEELVIFGAYDRILHYLDRETGREVHKVEALIADIYSSVGVFTYEYEPTHDLPMVFVADNDGMVLAIDGTGEPFWNTTHRFGVTSSPIVATGFNEPFDPFIIYGDQEGYLHGYEVLNPYVNRDLGLYTPVQWHVKLGTSIQSSPFLYHERVYVGAETGGGGGVIACIGDPDLADELFIDIVPLPGTDHEEGRVKVMVRVNGTVPDRVEVTFDGTTIVAVPPGSGEVLYSAEFLATPPEGMRPVLARAIIDGQPVLETVGETLSLVEGWDLVEITVQRPDAGQVVEGVIVVSGTASSNYTILSVEVSWDDTEDWSLATGTDEWTAGLETGNLSSGDHTLVVRAFDGYRWGTDRVKVKVEDGETMEVSALEVGAFLLLFIVLLVLIRTKPPRTSEGASEER